MFETDIGRIGILVCADGRLPEIARSLMLNGAQIILDLTAWVSGGRTQQDLSTPQVEFLMPTRAAENGVWIACCDKSGIEAESIVYAGRSCFINPRGRDRRGARPGGRRRPYVRRADRGRRAAGDAPSRAVRRTLASDGEPAGGARSSTSRS